MHRTYELYHKYELCTVPINDPIIKTAYENQILSSYVEAILVLLGRSELTELDAVSTCTRQGRLSSSSTTCESVWCLDGPAAN